MIPGRERPAARSTPIHAVAGIGGLWPRMHESQLISDTMIQPHGCTENRSAFFAATGRHENADRALATADMIEPVRNVE
jgi:hypothetical protein